MQQFRIRNVFGPVPSRRLGRSLGIDLVPSKACSYDCIYCQLGQTTNKTVERREYVPMTDILMELEERLAVGADADYITLSGSGEPTLHSDIGDIIRTIRTMTDIPVAVLTNASLLGDADVRRDLAAADLVIPSLDAGDEEAFARVNQPHGSISYGAMIEGLSTFAREYKGQIWLEVLLLDGITATAQETGKIARQVKKIRTDRIQIGTVSRPPASDAALPPSAVLLEELAKLFEPTAEIIHGFSGTIEEHAYFAGKAGILDLVQGRPHTLDEISGSLAINRNETLKLLEGLLNEGLLNSRIRRGMRYFESVAL